MSAVLLMLTQGVWAWQGSGTADDPYLISSTADWQELATQVEAGNDYSGTVFRMTANIDAQGTSVGTAEHPFSGIFDGWDYTLTYNKGAAANYATERCAPFRFVSGATIRHLKTTGMIYSSEQYAGGIVSMVNGSSVTTLTDCHSDIRLYTPSPTMGYVLNNAAHGGLVGAVNTGGLTMDRCTFEGEFDGENSAGMVGWSNVDITISNSMVDFSNPIYVNGGRTFARMADGAKLTITDSYFTSAVERFDDGTTTGLQGECVFNSIILPEGCTYEFESEPTVNLNGEDYWKSGARIRLTAPDDIAFDHWYTKTNGCYINDPWTRDGSHVITDVKLQPTFSIATEMPEATTSKTFYGVEYRYLSRRDYHLYVSEETCRAKNWTFESDADNAELITYDSDGDKLYITAVTGHTSDLTYNFDGSWPWQTSFSGTFLMNDNVSGTDARTHLGVIAPRAFKGCTELTNLAFQSDEGHPFYEVIHQPDFIIGEEAFADCPNLQQVIMMYYNRTGEDTWQVMPPSWVIDIAPDAFRGSDNCRIMVDPTAYQQYLNDERWSAQWPIISLYMKADADMKVNGAVYSYMRDNQNEPVKNNAAGHESLMQTLRYWNADYMNFTASSLLANSDKNIWYTQVTGVDASSLGSDGTMRIYNDPGSYYNYKTIAIGENAFKGNTDLKAIEFWQTNGRSENSYTDLKMVIQNGAFKDCKNLKELRMFYYVQDGDDHWETLGPDDVIPGDNIFGEPTTDEEWESIIAQANLDSNTSAEDFKLDFSTIPKDFRILVAPSRYMEFMESPNWQRYSAYIEPADFTEGTTEALSDFTIGDQTGITYGYMTAPGGIRQTSQTVSQDVSWWTLPRIAVEVALYALSIASAHTKAAALEQIADKQAFIEKIQPAEQQLRAALQMTTLQGEGRWDMIIAADADAVFAGKTPAQFAREYGINLNNQMLGQLQGLDVYIPASGRFGNIEHMTRVEMMDHFRCFTFFHKAFMDKIELLTTEMAQIRKSIDILFLPYHAAMGSAGSVIAANTWGGSGNYSGESLQKGMRANILSNIHQVSVMGGGYVITTPVKNIVYHTYIKNVADNVTDAVIYAGTDKGQSGNANARTTSMAKNAFRNHKNLETVSFFENNVSTNEAVPMHITIPDSAFVGCDKLRELNLLLNTKDHGTQALGPESFVLGGDNIFAGRLSQAEVDSLTRIGKGDGLVAFHIRIDESRKQDFLDNESWKPLEKYFVYDNAMPKADFNEYGAKYAYAYENGSVQKVHKVKGHKIEHLVVTGATERSDCYRLYKHQGALKLCNDIGSYNNYQLDAVKKNAFKKNENLREVYFTDLYGAGAFGTSYTGLNLTLEDSCFAHCPNLTDVNMIYLVTDGKNRIDPLTPQQVKLGKGVFDGSKARLKMLPQQVAWFEADSTWAKYKDRFQPCIIRVADEGVRKALKDKAFEDKAATGTDDSYWTDYIDYASIAPDFSWLNGRFTAYKDDIRSFADFKYFESVGLNFVGDEWFKDCSLLSNILLPDSTKTIGSRAFQACTKLEEIELPATITMIKDNAFSASGLKTIVVRSTTPATLGSGAFPKNDGMKIYVPAGKVDTYKQAWSEYAEYIVGDDSYRVNKVINLTEPGTLADELGLSVEWSYSGIIAGDEPLYVHGNYSKYDSLTVSGPLNDLDLAVIRYLSGADSYHKEGGDYTDGRVRYLNLYNASIVKDENCKAHYINIATPLAVGGWQNIKEDNVLPLFAFDKCKSLETVILPKSITKIEPSVFVSCNQLTRLAMAGSISAYDDSKYMSGIVSNPLTELVFITDTPAQSEAKDPWGVDIGVVYTKKSQIDSYVNQPFLTIHAPVIIAPFEEDAVMESLAQKNEFFPSQYLARESVEGIFNHNDKIKNFNDFYVFRKVKRLEYTFAGDTELKSIALPDSLEFIGDMAFAGCFSLDTIRIACDSVPELAAHAFRDLKEDFQILVPKELCKLYRTKWAEYADHINPDLDEYSNEEILVVTTKQMNTLAQELGLKVTTDSKSSVWAHDYEYITSVRGEYRHINKLKIIGPISGQDLSLLRYMAGFCPWANSKNSYGNLEYIDLYDAELKASDFAVASDMFWKTTRVVKVEDDNVLPAYSFLQSYNLKTLILPKTCKKVRSRAIQQCEALETLVIGDDCEEFDWSALDDDAMLSRLYILAKKKPELDMDNWMWRNLCNNYHPTFDAFYVRPSLYNEYLQDDAYVGSTWQRTNNVSTGMFDEDDSFCAFASHAAASLDDLFGVTNVDGWFDGHTNVTNLQPLGYTSISSLQVSDMQALTKLQKIELPGTFKGFYDDLTQTDSLGNTIPDELDHHPFTNATSLSYLNILACDSTSFIDELRGDIKQKLGVNDDALVYVPAVYGTTDEHNVVWGDAGNLQNNYFDINDAKDYSVPMAFKSQHISSSRVLMPRKAEDGTTNMETSKYTVSLPYSMDVPAGAKAFKLSGREGSKLIFTEEQDRMKANTPYLVVLTNDEVTLSSDIEQTIPTAVEAEIAIGQNQIDVLGASMRGTIKAIDNATAADLGTYILQSDNKWHKVPAGVAEASIPAFRTYLLQNGGTGAKAFTMELLEDGVDGIDTIQTIEADGTERYYDLSGREIVNGKLPRGVYIHNGKKYINK